MNKLPLENIKVQGVSVDITSIDLKSNELIITIAAKETTKTVVYHHRHGKLVFVFTLDDNGILSAKVYDNRWGTKTDEEFKLNWEQGKFHTISENDIMIRVENMRALMQGYPQKTFLLSSLGTEQKRDILKTIETNKREVTLDDTNLFGGYKIIIHAEE